MLASKLIKLYPCYINEAILHLACIFLNWIVKSNHITVPRNISTSSFNLPGKKNVCFCVLFWSLHSLLSQSSVISITGCLLFFFFSSCNQTRRFISVPLKHHRNQFPSRKAHGRAAAVWVTPVHAFHSSTHTHIGERSPPPPPCSVTSDTHRGKHAGRWFTTSLFSNVLLASSLQHPFVFADGSWQQHLSILAFALAPSAHTISFSCDLLPLLNSELQSFFFLPTSRTEYCACEWLLY